MRQFIYFSRHAATSGKALSGDLMKAGRLDIAIHVLIAAFFLSHSVREDVKLHLIFYGMPDPPKHIEIQVKKKRGVPQTGEEKGSLDISKKDVAGLLKKILYKYKEGKKTEVFPGCFVEKKSFLKLIEELQEEGKEIFILDKQGADVRNISIPEDSVFVLGDHEGLPPKELRRLKKMARLISVGPKMYFASHVVAVINNELDRRI
jgi:tRNA (pseudouridine54-N1)-methyltransferase